MKQLALVVPVLFASIVAVGCSGADATGASFDSHENTGTAALALEGAATWQQNAGGSQHASVNGYDTAIGVANVPGLVNYWFESAIAPTTPAVVGGMMYSGSADGTVRALDLNTWQLAWSRTLPATSYYSPAVGYGRVFLTAAHSLYALDSSDGGTISEAVHEGDVSFSAPMLYDGKVFVRDADGKVFAYDARASGSPAPLFTLEVGASADPTGGGGKVYVVSNDGRVHAFASSGCAGSCAPLWSSDPLGGVAWFAPALWSGRVIVTVQSDTGSTAVALDATTGATLWSTSLGDPKYVTGPAVGYGLVVVAASQPSELRALSLSTGALTWHAPLADDPTDTPSIANRLVYVPSGRTTGHLEVFDTKCGTGGAACGPTTDFGGEPYGCQPSIAGGRVYSSTATRIRVLALSGT